nr:MAG TPA: hypothetical protein [Caudoviricetes sp.]
MFFRVIHRVVHRVVHRLIWVNMGFYVDQLFAFG